MYISLKEKLKMLAQSLHQALFSSEQVSERKGERRGEASLHQLIMSTMIKWAQQPIHSQELIQQIFALLYRQCDQINELVRRTVTYMYKENSCMHTSMNVHFIATNLSHGRSLGMHDCKILITYIHVYCIYDFAMYMYTHVYCCMSVHVQHGYRHEHCRRHM